MISSAVVTASQLAEPIKQGLITELLYADYVRPSLVSPTHLHQLK